MGVTICSAMPSTQHSDKCFPQNQVFFPQSFVPFKENPIFGGVLRWAGEGLGAPCSVQINPAVITPGLIPRYAQDCYTPRDTVGAGCILENKAISVGV